MPKFDLPPLALFAALLAALLTLTHSPAQAADPAPVLAGLWEVNLLTSFAPLATSVAPDLAPRRRIYRICIGQDRVREPMHPPRSALRTETTIGRSSVSGSYVLKAADGQTRPVEFSYQRLDATRFEGSLDVQQADQMARTQYMARRVTADCGGLAPQPVPDSGEP